MSDIIYGRGQTRLKVNLDPLGLASIQVPAPPNSVMVREV